VADLQSSLLPPLADRSSRIALQLQAAEYAVNMFREVLIHRPDEPQSHRDLAFALTLRAELVLQCVHLHDSLLRREQARSAHKSSDDEEASELEEAISYSTIAAFFPAGSREVWE